MRPTYRLVWFIRDPYARDHVPLGALVEHDGNVTFVPMDSAGRLDLAPAERHLVARMTRELTRATSFTELPAGLGPHAGASDPRPLHASWTRLQGLVELQVPQDVVQ